MKPLIKNNLGEVVTLTRAEQFHADYNQRQYNALHGYKFNNALGFERIITTLTEIVKSITTQKFFQIVPSEYIDVRVGQGAWASNLLTYRSFDIADAFETGILNLANQTSRLASVSTGIDSITVQIFNWAKSIEWSIFALEEAFRSGNWSLIESLEISRKRNADLGFQRIVFLGANGQNGVNGNCLGLLNQGAGVNVNTTVITQPISSMTPAQLKVFCATIVEAYRENVQRSAWPTIFLIPESDYNGLASQASPEFPIKSTLELLEETFKLICRNPNFKILPCAYADMAYSGFGYQIYALYNKEAESLRVDIPVPYTSTMANTLNSFQYQAAAYMQFTGAMAYRPLELLYFTYVP